MTQTMGLSVEEQTIFDIIHNLGCISRTQAIYILKKYINCSPKQADVILKSLRNRNYIFFVQEDKYIICGGGNPNFRDKLNKGVIAGIYICLDLIDSLEGISFAIHPNSGSDLVFIADNKCYQTMYITLDSVAKIKIMEQKYKQEAQAHNKVNDMTIFIFESTVDVDEALEQVGELNLQMPHEMVFLKSLDLANAPGYDCYK